MLDVSPVATSKYSVFFTNQPKLAKYIIDGSLWQKTTEGGETCFLCGNPVRTFFGTYNVLNMPGNVGIISYNVKETSTKDLSRMKWHVAHHDLPTATHDFKKHTKTKSIPSTEV